MTSHCVSITVTGHAEREFAPNRCTVVLRVHADGATREAAAGPAEAATSAVTDLVTALRAHENSPVRRWSLDQVRHSRHRPYHPDGKRRPWLYQSSASITVTFTDSRAVGPFVTRAAELEAVDVEPLRWWVSRKAEAKRLAKVRRLAVTDALEKAQGYTESLGYSTFHAVAIADAGMLSVPAPPAPRAMMRAAAPMAAAASAPDATAPGHAVPVLEPDRITIGATVEARFEAS